MKMNAHKQKLAVVVPSLTPAFGLLVMQATDGHRPGEVIPLYGGYRSAYDGTETVYASGTVPPDWRLCVEEAGYDNEILFLPLPAGIEEINLNENPGTYQLVLTDCKIIPMPEPDGKVVQFTPNTAPTLPTGGACKVIEHPAAARQEKPAAQLKSPFADINPNQQTA